MSIFSKIKIRKPKRSVHNLSYVSQLSLPFGRLIPTMCEKVVPGDKMVHSHEFFMRFAPFNGQVFQNFQVRNYYFFVPTRLLWENFERFLSSDDNDFVHPYADFGNVLTGADYTGTLFDYFNLPTVKAKATAPFYEPLKLENVKLPIDILPFAAYLKIYLDYFCDENLTFTHNTQTLTYQELVDNFEASHFFNGTSYWSALISYFSIINNSALNAQSAFLPFKQAYPKDYFTSALPWAQRGPLVQIPLNGTGDVQVIGLNNGDTYTGVGVTPVDGAPTDTNEEVEYKMYRFGTQGSANVDYLNYNPASQSAYAPITFKAVNVNGTATINDLRTALAVQRWLEVNAVAGVRYKEQLASHFGVRSKDHRLDRAELLQMSKGTINIGDIFTTAQNDDNTFTPGMAVSTAKGSGASKTFKHFFEEHGYVIGLMSVYPKASYHQGIPRQFLEVDKFDYYWPEFQNIGEQEIYNCELFCDGDNPTGTFGYTPRYAHYKTRTNQVHADFRTHLNYFHDGRRFINAPTLSREFINIDVGRNDLYRVFNFTEEFENSYPCFCDLYHNCKMIRPMEYFGTPRII